MSALNGLYLLTQEFRRNLGSIDEINISLSQRDYHRFLMDRYVSSQMNRTALSTPPETMTIETPNGKVTISVKEPKND